MGIWWLSHLMWRCLSYFRWQGKKTIFPNRKDAWHKPKWQFRAQTSWVWFGNKELSFSEVTFHLISLGFVLALPPPFSCSKQTIKPHHTQPQENAPPVLEQGSPEALASEERKKTVKIAPMLIYFLKAHLWSLRYLWINYNNVTLNLLIKE